jgi:broad specificity phosphatase PhoE
MASWWETHAGGQRRATVVPEMAIYLVRHGETPGNAALIVQKPELPLSPRGIEQAHRVALRLAGEGIGQILSSDLTRAVMTAEAIAETTGAPLRFDSLLQERNFGEVRGTPYVELGFDLFAPDYQPPGGESWERFEERMDEAWELIERAAEGCRGNLVVVTHGLVCRSVVARRTCLPGGGEPSLRGLAWRNASVTILDGPDPWVVRLLNCSAHLAEVEPDGGGAV